MRFSLVSSVVTAAVGCSKVTCDAFHVHAGRSTSLRYYAHRTNGVGIIMKESASPTAESLEDLRRVQKENGGVIGDARYEDGETLWQDVFDFYHDS